MNEPVTLYVFIKNEKAVSLYERLGFVIVETIKDSRYIMKRDNRKYYAAYEERYKTAHANGVSCKQQLPRYSNHFSVLDCLSDRLEEKFDFIFSIAVVHMLVVDEDRDGFYQFIRNHLNANGIALICAMGNGEIEIQSDISTAYTLQERNHESGKMMVAGTSCRMVSWNTLESELTRNGLTIVEKGITSSLPDFNSLMYVVVKASNS